jgi:hexosaminidase
MKLRLAVAVPALLIGVLLSWPLLKAVFGGPPTPLLIPLPEKIETHGDSFTIRSSTRILADSPSRETAEYLGAQLRKVTAFNLPISIEADPGQGRDAIIFTTRGANQNLGAEGYQLNATSGRVIIRAGAAAGLFYGVQCLLQLLPPEVCGSKSPSNPRLPWTMPGVVIEDRPRFPWRGFMLDVSRHFFSKTEVERVLDLMALHKLNTFHWHLTDDQGWRIEIKRYPLLTEAGAWRKHIGYGLDPKASAAYGVDGRYGGYYTQKDVKEIVAYAAARHITVVPEIELPGHSSAALQAYPEFTCSGSLNPNRPAEVYCAGKEQTFEFLENVLAEVCDLFPGRYIHIGGDEVSKSYWKDCPQCQKRMQQEGLSKPEQVQAYFITRIAKFLATKDRVAIGWSEIQESKLPANVALMDWTGGGPEAAAQGHPVVMTPNTYCYFDYYQSRDRAGEPPAAGAYLPQDKVYSFEPIPAELVGPSKTNILGAQANLWTEYIPSLKQAEYMMFPRLCALSEVVWSTQTTRNENDFMRRLKVHLLRLDQLGVNYRKEMVLFTAR